MRKLAYASFCVLLIAASVSAMVDGEVYAALTLQGLAILIANSS